MKSEPEQTNKPEAPVYDKWVPSGEGSGLSLKMYRSGGVVLEYKRYNPERKKYERCGSPLALSRSAVEALRDRYHEIKALREKLAREAGEVGAHA